MGDGSARPPALEHQANHLRRPPSRPAQLPPPRPPTNPSTPPTSPASPSHLRPELQAGQVACLSPSLCCPPGCPQTSLANATSLDSDGNPALLLLVLLPLLLPLLLLLLLL